MAARVVPVDSAAENGDCPPARFKCASMRLAVDPAREAAHHHESCGRQLARE